MVCIPCIILPVALWVYAKFLQPFILRWMPPTWRAWLDNWLYPTCPVKPPPSKTPVSNEGSTTDEKGNRSETENGELKHRKIGSDETGQESDEDGLEKSCCGGKGKSPSDTLECNGHIVVGGPDKKID